MKKLTTREKTAIKYVLQDFDFEKCSKAMKMFDWKWGRGEKAVFPSAHDIEVVAEGLMSQLFVDELKSAETGGLRAKIDTEDGNRCLVLEFILERGQGGRYV